MSALQHSQKILRDARDYEAERLRLITAQTKGLPTNDYMVALQRYHLADDAALAMDKYVAAFGRQREEA